MRLGPFLGIIGALFLASAGQAGELAKPEVRFDRDVQPILSRYCLRCHATESREGGLALTDPDSAFAELESGNFALVPRQPENSELLRRITAADPGERMPPEGPALTDSEVEVLRRWVEAGAPWPSHWAYRPLERPPVAQPPAAFADWVQTPIDAFILRELEQHGLRPSPPADRRTLLRRVYFDLIGLPPTPEEVERFENDSSPDAYERVVDQLLASPHYGERWARHWMDLVHYAETHGHDQDRPRPNAWPYRDYLIRSFNDDKPYPRFVEEQVAGDVLWPEDPQAIVATGFLATGPWDESSLRDIREDTLDREIARYLDRDDIVTTVMSTFTSTTVHCARCHDHKFDPVTQRDYYGLQAVFSATDKADRPYDPDPQVGRRRRELEQARAQLPARRTALDPTLLDPELMAEIRIWEQDLQASASAWTVLEPVAFESSSGSTLVKQEDGSLLSTGARPDTDVYTITVHTSEPNITGFRLEVLTDPTLPQQGPGRQDNGNLHLNELTVTAAAVGDPSSTRAVTLTNPRADFDQEGWTIALALDANPATAWGIFPEVGKAHQATFELREPLAFAEGTAYTFRLEQTHGGGHLIGRLRISATTVGPPVPLNVEQLPSQVVEALRTAPESRSEQQQVDLAAYYFEQKIAQQLAELGPPAKVYTGTNRFEPDGTFRPADKPRTVHVLHRGDVREPIAEAQPRALSCLPGQDGTLAIADLTDEGARRAALARWLTARENVLTWRSIANRIWQFHFGRGLCDTPNDFGRMGSVPTHPELLDWLAVELRDGHRSLKELHRLIVTSAVYCQSSAHQPEMAEIDADNRYLWRMNRQRLDAESLRDAVLGISGRLDATMGGPSVKQFIQTPGVHVTPNVDYANFDVDDPANYRRSVYRFIFRTLPDPFMQSLDCPDGSQLTPQRGQSVSALQALALLNNGWMLRQCEHLAERLAEEHSDSDEQIRELYRLALLREPAEDELRKVSAYARQHGLANACRILLNTNEFMFVD